MLRQFQFFRESSPRQAGARVAEIIAAVSKKQERVP